MFRSILLLPEKLYVVVALVFITTAADIYLAMNALLPISPVVACLVLIFPFLGYACMKELAGDFSMAKVIYVYRHNMSAIVPFCALTICALLFSFLPASNWEDSGKFVFLPLYDCVFFIFGMALPLIAFFRNSWRSYLRIALLALLASIGIDLIYPGFFSNVILRSAGFAENPNAAAFFVIILCSSIVRYHKVSLEDISIIILSGIGTLATLSRSGVLLFCLFLMVYFFQLFIKGDLKNRFALIFLSLVSVFTIAVVFAVIVQKSYILEVYCARDRLRSLIGDTAFYQSDEGRIVLLEKYIALVGNSPFLGYGTGFSLDVGPHNMYLKQWLENGVFGFLSYVSLLAGGLWIFYKRKFREGQTFMFIVMGQGVFSHNILDQRPFLLIFGVLLGISLFEYNHMKALKKTVRLAD